MASTPNKPRGRSVTRAKPSCHKTEKPLQTTTHREHPTESTAYASRITCRTQKTKITRSEHPNLEAAAAASTGELVDILTLKEHLVDTKTRAVGNSLS